MALQQRTKAGLSGAVRQMTPHLAYSGICQGLPLEQADGVRARLAGLPIDTTLGATFASAEGRIRWGRRRSETLRSTDSGRKSSAIAL